MFRRCIALGTAVVITYVLSVGAQLEARPTKTYTQAAPSAGPPLALVGAHVVDVEAGTVLRDAVVVIDGDRIRAVGPASETSVPEGATIIQMHGKWILPGLINAHVHIALGAERYGNDATAIAFLMARNAFAVLQSGVTTVRIVGFESRSLELKAAIDRGEIPGPRIESAGRSFTATGGHSGRARGDGPYELAKLTRQQIKDGATWIKISISGGINDTHGSISASTMTREELRTIIEVAHRNQVKVTAHNGSPAAADEAIELGIDSFEHGYHFGEKQLRAMKAKGVWLVPTISVTDEGGLEFHRRVGQPDWYYKRLTSVKQDHWSMLKQAVRIGVPIAVGTDMLPHEPHSGTTATVREIELYVEAGMQPLQALRAATLDAATLLELHEEIGSIAPGKYADIIAINADPLTDIRALRTIDLVMKSGRVVRDDGNARHTDQPVAE